MAGDGIQNLLEFSGPGGLPSGLPSSFPGRLHASIIFLKLCSQEGKEEMNSYWVMFFSLRINPLSNKLRNKALILEFKAIASQIKTTSRTGSSFTCPGTLYHKDSPIQGAQAKNSGLQGHRIIRLSGEVIEQCSWPVSQIWDIPYKMLRSHANQGTY